MTIEGLGTRKLLSILLDPDKGVPVETYSGSLERAEGIPDLFLAGGSLLSKPIDQYIRKLKEKTHIPVFLFPGNTLQLTSEADGILLLSLISGRNPDLLVGQHVQAARMIRAFNLRVLPTGYLLVRCGKMTSVEYMSNTRAIPVERPDIILATATAGELLGLRAIYLEAGSGADFPVPPEIIRTVSREIRIPLIVGGGINTPEKLQDTYKAGADMVVIGNALEKNPSYLWEALKIRDSFNQ